MSHCVLHCIKVYVRKFKYPLLHCHMYILYDHLYREVNVYF